MENEPTPTPDGQLNPSTISGESSQGGGEQMAPEAQHQTNWTDDFSPEFREALTNDSVGDLEGLQRGYLNMRSKLGQAVFIPTQDAGPETWDRFYGRLENVPGLARHDPNSPPPQAPASPDQYQWTPPEGYEPDPVLGNELAQVAHKVGLSNDQLSELRNYFTQKDLATDNEINQQTEQGIGQLKEDWGLAFENKLQTSQQAVEFLDRTLGFKGSLVEALNDTGAGNIPEVIKLFEALGRNLNKDPKLKGEADSHKIDPSTAEQRIADIFANKDHPYHRGDPTALKLMQSLQKAKLGGNNRVVVEDLRLRAQSG